MNSKTNFLLLICILFLWSCSKKSNNGNELKFETSPYLLQHANNPVHWKPWNSKTLELAKKENKLIIISIGYSACHWCHVMEKESFTNDSIAKIMNTNFINIKVDREERPDIDNIYMNAVQLMTGSGGWPLNCIALPDGRPIFGGTYFTKEQWKSVLQNITKLYKENPEKAINFANKLTDGIKNSELITLKKENINFKESNISKAVLKWQQNFDTIYGGSIDSPKFPMPNSLDFLLRYAHQFKDKKVQKHIDNTLTKLAHGGIYDQINGGFSRYATDKKWHIPHFEKMLYDNAQLVSLYAKAYQQNKNPQYKDVIIETLNFVKLELTDKNGTFFSSLDADSKNNKNDLEEGAYYYWTAQELQGLIKNKYPLFKEYYNINDFGLWEKERYVLIRKISNKDFSKKHKITSDALNKLVKDWKKTLKNARELKNKPNLDDKVLTSWNALMIKGYTDAYKALKNEDYLKSALKNANFIIKNQLKKDGTLYRNYKNGKISIRAFSEDYATLIDAFLNLYEVTLDEKWLRQSKKLMDYCLTHFFNKENTMFYFISNKDYNLISRKIKVIDNVIASPNSILANNLFKLGLYFADENYNKIAHQMLNNIHTDVLESAAGYSNWLHLMVNYTKPFYEVATVGKEAKLKNDALLSLYNPNVILAGDIKNNNTIPLLKDKFVKDETYVYVCNFGTCKLPQQKVSEAIKFIKK
ncbi:thioredoxin domain-containing protein [Polaribacter vadi]|uniref:thioredoxin domain-containing protein n=1 Tax=Polaribacter TaxID=52959 RepID=UPI001C086077|nr:MULTISPECIES: thioredoxin domain-containing protein [Polaribacter]MBU3012825.1 thioredoxin domain-containing protein [Polaribacter vadi]MDO6742641.1 thioredoxin domain-containing protein [Polaribacter sp. 1_MG-2023]